MRDLQTRRLDIRRMTYSDSPFILELVNEPGWLRYIGDKGVKTLEDAKGYIRKGPMEMYSNLGIGLCAVDLRKTGESIGICGLIKRASLEDVDLGFAVLERFWGSGYAFEAATRVLEYAWEIGLRRVVAITTADNDASEMLLGKLGFERDGTVVLDSKELTMYSVEIES